MTSYRIPTGIAWLENSTDPSEVFVAMLPRGPVQVLQGTAALIWSAAIDGEAVTLPERVAAAAELPVDEVRVEVERFISELMAAGLLSPP
ncbi:PqqD family peptide modification chaperone [Janibacter sp. GS2]|uniref:PqqD family peptide modification chaperone n=1 Tax=Janibacter sp. GS2 TaxID=3442646 RepID=UPI003EB8EBE6